MPERSDAQAPDAGGSTATETVKRPRRSFRPSAKGTIAGIIAILVVIGANIGIISFILSHKVKQQATNLSTVVTDPSQLGKIGTTEGPAGQNVSLVVTPAAQFKNQVTIDKTLQVGDKLAAPNASLATLQAGNSSISQLNVSGASSFSDASLRGNLNVAGITNLQGAVSVAKILTAAALNVTGNLTVGGSFTTNNFSARSLTSISTLTIGGHIVTAGSAPSISAGSCVGGGSVSISGNDAAGTIVISIGQTPCVGNLATITFRSAFGSTPHILLTPVGHIGGLQYYVGRSSTGFSISSDSTPDKGGVPPTFGNYAFDYEVIQ